MLSKNKLLKSVLLSLLTGLSSLSAQASDCRTFVDFDIESKGERVYTSDARVYITSPIGEFEIDQTPMISTLTGSALTNEELNLIREHSKISVSGTVIRQDSNSYKIDLLFASSEVTGFDVFEAENQTLLTPVVNRNVLKTDVVVKKKLGHNVISSHHLNGTHSDLKLNIMVDESCS
ncbi:MAG: hypothetical protein IBX55_01040 [Methyloprofundus sp.]|nr:hypothetical protein [Methyloprofundus sp.]